MNFRNVASYRQYLAPAFFGLTSIQLIFLWPYVVVINGERANIFSGMLCAVTLLATLIFNDRRMARVKPVEIIISFLLIFFAAGSAALSSTPVSSGWRTFVILSSCLGGYWSSRIILCSMEARKAFVYFCCGLLICLIALIFTAFATGRPGHILLDVNPHPVCSRILLLSFAPITLITTAVVAPMASGIIMLIAAYACLVGLLVWGQLSTAPIFPIAMLFVCCLFFWRSKKVRVVLIALLAFACIMAVSFAGRIKEDLPLDSQSFTYRYENVFFSARIALSHPFFGIGARSPREEYLEGYVVRHPLYTKEKFEEWTKVVTTSDTLPLTLLADFGFPFSIIYGASVLLLTLFLVRLARKKPPDFYPHPIALLLPVLAILMHSLILDIIYLPQVSWFFHILLGMTIMGTRDRLGT